MNNKLTKTLFVLFLLFILTLTYFLFKSFIITFIWAVLIVAGLKPMHNFILSKIKKKSLSSLITCFIIFLIMFIPFLQISYSLYNQSTIFIEKINIFFDSINLEKKTENLFNSKDLSNLNISENALSNENKFYQEKTLLLFKNFENKINTKMLRFNIKINVLDILKNFLIKISNIFTKIPNLISKISSFFIDFIFLFIFMFYLFRDGKEFLSYLIKYLPFEKTKIDIFLIKFKEISQSTILSSFIIAIIQGILGFIIFLILNQGEPILWGAFISIFSFIPIVGTTIIWLPAAIIIFIKGHIIKGIIMLLWGIFVIGMADNLLRPILIKNKIKIDFAFLFFGILGGINTFGLLGIFLGPIILSFLMTTLEMFRENKSMI